MRRGIASVVGTVAALAAAGMASVAAAQQPTFEEVRQALRTRLESSLGPGAAATWNQAGVFVSRESVSRVAGTLLEGAHLSLRARLPQQQLDIPPTEVRTPRISERNCSADRWGCDSDCGWDVGCAIRKGLCEANKTAQKGLCEAQKVAELAISDKKIFTVSPHAVNVSAEAGARFHLSLDPGLTKATVSVTDLSGTFHLIGGSVTLEPELLPGILTACAKTTLTIPGTDVSIDQGAASATADLDFRVEGGAFVLSVHARTPTLAFRFNENPVHRVVERNLHTLVTCPVVGNMLLTVGGLFDLGWNDRVSLPAGTAAFSLPLGDLRLAVPGVPGGALQPRLDSLSIGWVGEPALVAEVR